MTESCAYVKETYNVPADIGRRVAVDGKPGIIAADKGHYIGVNFDEDQPGVIKNCHPTWKIEYLEMGQIRVKKMTRSKERSQERYQRFLEYGDGFDSFIQFCYWDASPKRSWNGGWH